MVSKVYVTLRMFQEAVLLHLDLCRSGCCSLVERVKITQKETAESFFTMYFNFSSLIFCHISVDIFSDRDVYLSFDGFVLLKEGSVPAHVCVHEEKGAVVLPSLTLYFGKIRMRGLKHAAHHSLPH